MIDLFNGDALEKMKTMQSACVDVLMTDPPYSSGGAFRSDREGDTSSKYQNTETKKEYPNFSGDNRDQLAYYYWCALWIGQCARILKPGGIACMFTDWRQLATTINAFQIGGLVWRGVIPWNKTEAARPTRGRFRAQCEYVIWGTNGPMQEGTEECLPGFFTYSVRPGEKQHVTGKPFSLMVDLMKVCGDGPKIVFDPFMGSGTTGAACVSLGHSFIGCEADPSYFEIATKTINQAARQPGLFKSTIPAAVLEQQTALI
jgi:site-specific DNA-methyltransferase (adenine-specific)